MKLTSSILTALASMMALAPSPAAAAVDPHDDTPSRVSRLGRGMVETSNANSNWDEARKMKEMSLPSSVKDESMSFLNYDSLVDEQSSGYGSKSSKSCKSSKSQTSQPKPYSSELELRRAITSEVKPLASYGGKLIFSFPDINCFDSPTSDVEVHVFTRGDINSYNEYYAVTAEGSVGLGTTSNGDQCDEDYHVDTFIISQTDFNSYIADGMLTIEADATSAVDYCTINDVYIRLVYSFGE